MIEALLVIALSTAVGSGAIGLTRVLVKSAYRRGYMDGHRRYLIAAEQAIEGPCRKAECTTCERPTPGLAAIPWEPITRDDVIIDAEIEAEAAK